VHGWRYIDWIGLLRAPEGAPSDPLKRQTHEPNGDWGARQSTGLGSIRVHRGGPRGAQLSCGSPSVSASGFVFSRTVTSSKLDEESFGTEGGGLSTRAYVTVAQRSSAKWPFWTVGAKPTIQALFASRWRVGPEDGRRLELHSAAMLSFSWPET
jgi:hypothetical protein